MHDRNRRVPWPVHHPAIQRDRNIDPSCSSFDYRTEGAHVNISECHGSVVALQHDGIQRGLGDLHARPRSAFALHILLYEQPVVQHAQESRILNFLACGVKRGARNQI
jgi:hypothetical protein